MDGSSDSKAKFTKDCWGKFDTDSSSTSTTPSGGITRVMQGGDVIEKGACSLTVIDQGILSQERAAAIQSRQDNDLSIQAGDLYWAAALSIVVHSRSPLVPTFRSDVRIFVVTSSATTTTVAWFGGGADLTPYYLNDDDVTQFHAAYKTLTDAHDLGEEFTYDCMKKACDDYFYLPARSEHRGTGGIFFDDLVATPESLDFVKGVAKAWVPSWKPIVNRHRNVAYTEQQRHWQLLRRGRYLEFNLLYDRGVKFGLAAANPRVEGVMVSAPPLIAWEYNHVIEQGSPEAKLMEVLKTPRAWV
ncbi:Coproporphyrinogen III oxidase [Fragilaria crotonensis]|nr:Coproporphyrinogen III oxidase [Fragilaria crotonensis]